MTPLLVYWMQPIFTQPILAIAPAHFFLRPLLRTIMKELEGLLIAW